MKDRLKELAEQAGLISTWEGWVSTQKQHAEGVCDEYLERFADLIRQDEAKACAEHYLGIMRDAVEQAVLKERERLKTRTQHKQQLMDGQASLLGVSDEN